MRAQWDKEGERYFECGVDRGMFYLMKDNGTYDKGEVWNGLTNVSENPEGAEDNDFYADNLKYVTVKSKEEFKATIGCYTYPDGFASCNGEKAVDTAGGLVISGQERKKFAFCYRVKLGNDIKGEDYAYEIHIVYGCSAGVSSKDNNTINENVELNEMSFDISTTKPELPTGEAYSSFKPSAHFIINSLKAGDKLATLEDMLYGTDGDPEAQPPVEGTDPTIPTPKQLIDMFRTAG